MDRGRRSRHCGIRGHVGGDSGDRDRSHPTGGFGSEQSIQSDRECDAISSAVGRSGIVIST